LRSEIRNIKIAYLIAALRTAWFFLGVWVFYYLLFTNYAGIGLIESILIITMTTMEIPTGALADLLGKKKTLTIAFLLQSAGIFSMALAPNFTVLAFSVFIASLGGTLYSGTMEALVFDTLKEEGKEAFYDRVLANIKTYQLIMMAACGALGGFMYGYNPRLPFFACATAYFLALLLTFFLKEPTIDTIKFSLKNFVIQNKQGLIQLFKTIDIKRQTLMLLSIGGFLVIADEMLNDILAVEFGFNEKQLGIFVAVIFLISAGISQIAPKIRRHFKETDAILLMGGLIAITFAVSPLAGLFLGGLSLIFRASFKTVYENLASVIINNRTPSRYRATTISTFNMIKNLPYMISAYFLGTLMDLFTAKRFAFVLGILLFFLILVQLLKFRSARAASD